MKLFPYARIETVTDDTDLEEIYNTERHLLYVACTRARDKFDIYIVDLSHDEQNNRECIGGSLVVANLALNEKRLQQGRSQG